MSNFSLQTSSNASQDQSKIPEAQGVDADTNRLVQLESLYGAQRDVSVNQLEKEAVTHCEDVVIHRKVQELVRGHDQCH